MQRPGDARALERLRCTELAAERHQAGHLGLGNGDLTVAPGGKADVGDGVVVGSHKIGGPAERKVAAGP